jgi:hypothetical protein
MATGWVVFGYAVVYGFMIIYGASLVVRLRRVERRGQE